MLKQIVFRSPLTAALGMFAWTLRRFIKMLLAGRPTNGDRIEARVDSLLSFFFDSARSSRRGHSSQPVAPFLEPEWQPPHFIIFWGFLVIAFGTLEIFAQGLWPAFSWSLLLARRGQRDQRRGGFDEPAGAGRDRLCGFRAWSSNRA